MSIFEDTLYIFSDISSCSWDKAVRVELLSFYEGNGDDSPPYICHGGLPAKTSIGRTKKCSSLEHLSMEITRE